MAEIVKEQFYVFSLSLLMGMVLAFFYDMIRVLRRCAFKSRFFLHISDFLFWIIAAALVIAFINRYNLGSIRLYVFIGIAVAAFAYHYTLSVAIIGIADKIIGFGRKIRKNLYKVLKKTKKDIKIMSTSKNNKAIYK